MNYLYVHSSNLWLEGKHVAAVSEGFAPDIRTARQRNVGDPSFTIDFGRLYRVAGGEESDVGRAVLYGERPWPHDSIWQMAKQSGFEVIADEMEVQSDDRTIHVRIATDIVADSYESMDPATDEITLVAGGSEFVSTVDRLKKRGMKFTIVFWDHASPELKAAASRFVSLDPYLRHLRAAEDLAATS